jgi:predicted phage baseplate assembly protein
MPLRAPRLDDRTFQDLVDEAKKRIPYYCREWTDHNVSDPGITLIELFAWMIDTLLYRLNQVPDLHTINFLNLLGVRLREPAPAHAPVTFWLSEPQPFAVKIPAGTEVASTQTETERSIVFTTDADLAIHPPELLQVFSRVVSPEGSKKIYRRPYSLVQLKVGLLKNEPIFSSVPQVDDALYLGFANDLSHHILAIDAVWDSAGGGGVDPEKPPPHIWEASTGGAEQRWQPCEVALDTTKDLNVSGRIQLHLPAMGKFEANDQTLYWVRARIVTAKSGGHGEVENRNAYFASPLLKQLSVSTWGGTVPATHAQEVTREILGRSDGTAGQRFQLQRHPILRRRPGENLTVQPDNEPLTAWSEVPDFADSDAYSLHYTLDSVSGELRFGPAVRRADGTIKLFSAIPSRGASLVLERYRVGGGTEGNVRAGYLNTLKTAIPYVVKVENRQRAEGGEDQDSLEDALIRAPALLRSRGRAVTEADFEFLASEILPKGSRVRCLQPRPSEAGRVAPGQVYVLVIPHVADAEGYLSADQLEPGADLLTTLNAYLDERRLLTARLTTRRPEYLGVVAKVKLREAPGANRATVRDKVLARLYRFLNPLVGWTDQKGWPFGRTLFTSDVYQCLQGIPDVQFIRSAEIFAADRTGAAAGEARESIEVVAHGVIISGKHEVEFV